MMDVSRDIGLLRYTVLNMMEDDRGEMRKGGADTGIRRVWKMTSYFKMRLHGAKSTLFLTH